MVKKWKQFNEEHNYDNDQFEDPKDREFDKSEKMVKLEQDVLNCHKFGKEDKLKKLISKLKKEFNKRKDAEKGTKEFNEAFEIRGWLHQLRSKLVKISGDTSYLKENKEPKIIKTIYKDKDKVLDLIEDLVGITSLSDNFHIFKGEGGYIYIEDNLNTGIEDKIDTLDEHPTITKISKMIFGKGGPFEHEG